MSAFAKLGFIHRRLWQRDATYRVAALLGPPPLLGLGLAALLWLAFHPAPQPPPPPPWAHSLTPPVGLGPMTPVAAAPEAALPAADPHGRLAGFTTGWNGEIAPIALRADRDVTVLHPRPQPFTIDGPAVEADRIVAAGRHDGLYVGVLAAALAIRTAGVYALSARFTRTAAAPADCLVRLVFDRARLLSTLELGAGGLVSRTYDPTLFTLQPGLYEIRLAFGCWRDGQAVGPGEAAIMLQRPGETHLQPARADEILRPLR